jgi:hypothetical protein
MQTTQIIATALPWIERGCGSTATAQITVLVRGAERGAGHVLHHARCWCCAWHGVAEQLTAVRVHSAVEAPTAVHSGTVGEDQTVRPAQYDRNAKDTPQHLRHPSQGTFNPSELERPPQGTEFVAYPALPPDPRCSCVQVRHHAGAAKNDLWVLAGMHLARAVLYWSSASSRFPIVHVFPCNCVCNTTA